MYTVNVLPKRYMWCFKDEMEKVMGMRMTDLVRCGRLFGQVVIINKNEFVEGVWELD